MNETSSFKLDDQPEGLKLTIVAMSLSLTDRDIGRLVSRNHKIGDPSTKTEEVLPYTLTRQTPILKDPQTIVVDNPLGRKGCAGIQTL